MTWMNTRVWTFLGLVAAAAIVIGAGESIAQVKAGKTRPAATKYLMKGSVQPHCKALGDLLKAGPSDDKGWDTVACHAAILSELGYGLMDDGRCPDGAWAGATKSLRDGSAGVLKAAEAKDVEAARTAFKTLGSSCAGCHKAHKK